MDENVTSSPLACFSVQSPHTFFAHFGQQKLAARFIAKAASSFQSGELAFAQRINVSSAVRAIVSVPTRTLDV
jgi:hypothetical protein